MKKTMLPLLAAVALVALTADAADGRLKKLPKHAADAQTDYSEVYKGQGAVMLKSPQPMQASEPTLNYILVEENFDRFTAGSEDAPDFSHPIASSTDYSVGMWIDNTKTANGSWSGHLVYSAGGCVALEGPHVTGSAYLNTPIGDYSGDLTVTFRAKPLQREGNRCYLSVSANYGDIRNSSAAQCNDALINLYLSDKNWTEVSVPLKNYSANADGFIQFELSGDGCLLLDDIKITTSPTFIAKPVLQDAYFGSESITLKWNPVRRAYNYYLYLYKKVQISDEDLDVYEDFENVSADGSSLPEKWDFAYSSGKYAVDGYGADGSKGLALCQGDTLTVYNNGTNYHNVQFWLRSVYPSDQLALDDWNGSVCIDGFNGNKWIPLCLYYMNVFHAYEDPANGMPDYLDLVESCKAYWSVFADKYSKVRIYIKDCDVEDAWVALDNFSIQLPPPYEYQLITDHEGYDYTLIYEDTKFELLFDNQDDRYPYHGLKKEDDYYYELKSHYVYETSDAAKQEIRGIFKPKVEEPTGMTDNGYNAVWQPVVNASGYRIDHFTAETLSEDAAGFTVFAENFSKAGGAISDPRYYAELNNAEGSLDAYCDFAGWTGKYNTYVKGMLGTSDKLSYIQSPVVDLGHSSRVRVHLSAYGTYGDAVKITTSKGSWYVGIPQGKEMVHLDAWVDVDVDPTKDERIRLESVDRMVILFDEIKVCRDVRQGESILSFVKSYEVSADCSSAHVSTEGAPSRGFAYTVTAYRDYDGKRVYSAPSDKMLVGKPKIVSVVSTLPEVKAEHHVVGRYGMDGLPVDESFEGVQIVRYSDGTSVKQNMKRQ